MTQCYLTRSVVYHRLRYRTPVPVPESRLTERLDTGRGSWETGGATRRSSAVKGRVRGPKREGRWSYGRVSIGTLSAGDISPGAYVCKWVDF